MVKTPETRLLRLRRSCLRGWSRVTSDGRACEAASSWLRAHPSREPEVDSLWLQTLERGGELADWLASGADLERWPLGLPAHTVLASHPFAALSTWSIPLTSPTS